MRKQSLIFLFTLPFIILVALFFCWTSLKLSFVEWTLKEYCRKNLGVQISYEKSILLKHNMIHLQGVRVSPIDVECPHVYIKIGFDMSSKTLTSKVYLKDFELILDQPCFSLTTLSTGCQNRRSHFFDLQLSVQGEGEIVWSEHRSPLQIDFSLGDELEGAIQWEQVAGRFRIGSENRELAFIGHGVDAAHLFDLVSHVTSDLETFRVEKGLLSGSLSINGDHLVAALDGEDLVVSSGSWRGSCPSCHWDSLEEAGCLFFRSGVLTYPLGEVHDLEGGLSMENGRYHLFATGESSGVSAISDIVFAEGKICEGSYVQLESDSLYGELIFHESMGAAHFLGDDFELGAVWNPKLGGCQGEVTLFGKQSLDFTLNFLEDLSFQNGTFSGKGIDLSLFPSISLWDQSIDGQGIVDVDGQFDGSMVTMKMTSKQLILNGQKWNLLVPALSEAEVVYQWGTDEFHLESDFEGGTVIFPEKEISLTQLTTHCVGDSRGLRFEQCYALCNGVELGGDVMITFNPELDVEFYQHTLKGQVLDVQSLLRQFGGAHPLLDTPISGVLSCRDEGGFFKWKLETQVLEGTFGAKLVQGVMKDPITGTKWEHLYASFVYDLGTDHLVIREGKGLCKAPSGSSIPLVLDHLEVIDFSKRLVTFDFWCGDKKRDMLRACGKTVLDGDLLRVEFDPQVTHFGALYPEEFDLCFDANGSIDRFHLVTGFQLEALEEDLKQFFLSQNLWTSFFQDLQGNLFLKLDYETGIFRYFLHGKNLNTPQQKFQDFQFLGCYDHGEWHIQRLELDDFLMAADLVRNDRGFDVKFLGCQWGEASLLGLDGVISPQWNRIEANLNLVDLDLQDLESIDFLKPFFTQFNPQGSMRANNGRLIMVLNEGDWDIDLKFVASLKNFSLDGLQFQDMEKIAVAYQTEKKLLIKGIKSSDCDSVGIKLELDQVDLDLNRHELSIKGLAFQIPPENLETLNLFLERKFPGAVNSSISAVMREITPVKPLIGTVDFSLNPVQSVTEIHFEDGSYQFFDHVWSLKDFQFIKMDGDIALSARCQLWGDWVQLKTQYVGKSFPSGVLVLERGDDKLNVWWRKGGEPKITLDRVDGVIAGARVDISREGSHLAGTALSHELSSQIEIDSEKMVITKLNWKGKKGKITCPLATVFQSSNGLWQVEIPKIIGDSIQVDKFQHWSEFIDDTIVVKHLELTDIHGPLTQLEKISGRGSLSFYSPNQSDIRAFPFVKEKIHDLTVLKPVAGDVEFELNTGVLTLTSLTDVVDQRQLFRYQLSSTRHNILGVDGTVHLLFHLMPNHSKVRMGDLVSLVVEGTIDHPIFSLVKTKELQGK